MAKPVKHYGKWRIRWVDETGERRSEVFDSRNDALLVLQRNEVAAEEVRRGLRLAAPPKKTVNELCDYWLKNRTPLKRSPKDEESIIRRHIRPPFGHLLVTEVGVAHIDKFRAERVQLQKKTVNNALTTFITMLKAALELGWLLRLLTALRSCAAGNPEALLAEAEGAILSATLTPNEVTEERKHLLAQRFQARLGQLVLCLEEHRDSILSERDGMALMNALLFEFIDDEFAAGIDEEKARMAPVMRRAWIEFEHQPNPKSLSALTDDWLPSKMGSRTAYLPPSCAWCGSTRSRCCCPSSSPKYRLRRLRRTKSLLRG